jgi:hypothetical protein
MVESKVDYDLVQGYLYSFLNAHGEILASQPELKSALSNLERVMKGSVDRLDEIFQRNTCLCALLTKVEGL